MSSKRPTGPSSPKEERSKPKHQIMLSVTLDELPELQQAAERRGLALATYCRVAALAVARAENAAAAPSPAPPPEPPAKPPRKRKGST